MRAERVGVGGCYADGPDIPRMSVIPITVFFSLLLAGIFIALFAREQLRRSFAGAERDSLLPLADEARRPESAGHEHAEAGHDHGDDACGCRDGSRPPCAGCLKSPTSAEPQPHTTLP